MSNLIRINNKLMTKNNKLLTAAAYVPPVDPYNPLGLPPNTVRVRTNDGLAPTEGRYTSYETATLVTGTTDVYDVYKSGTDFESLLASCDNVIEILGANTTGVTNMTCMCYRCESLTTIPLFDTSSVTNMEGMFAICDVLTAIPLFDTSSVTNMNATFNSCYSVESGALALYNQASSQTTPPSDHRDTFTDCGAFTQTGAAELAQIPYSWGGNA